MTRLGLRAVTLESGTVQTAYDQGKNLIKEIQRFQYDVIIVSPERLTCPNFAKLMRSESFLKNIALLCIDEAHLVVPWGKSFREAYREISNLPSRMRARTPVLAMTATMRPGRAQNDLIRSLGIQKDDISITRLSTEQENLRLVVQTLTHGLGPGQKLFPDIKWIAAGQYKTIIYCSTTNLCERVCTYLQMHRPIIERKRNIRTYCGIGDPEENAETLRAFNEDPDTFVIVATIKCGMGLDLRCVQVVINLGLPATIEDSKQQMGRAGRDRSIEAFGILYAEKSYVSAVRRMLEKKKKRAEKQKENLTDTKDASEVDDFRIKHLDEGLQTILEAHVSSLCLVGVTNQVLGNVDPLSHRPCAQAQRTRPCSSCLSQEPFSSAKIHIPELIMNLFSSPSQPPNPSTAPNSPPNFLGAQDLSFPSPTPPTCIQTTLPSPSALSRQFPVLTKDMQEHATSVLDVFAEKMWLQKDGIEFRNLPSIAYFPSPTYHSLIKNLHAIRNLKGLAEIASEWEFFESDGIELLGIIEELNSIFDAEQKISKGGKGKGRAVAQKKAQGKFFAYSLHISCSVLNSYS